MAMLEAMLEGVPVLTSNIHQQTYGWGTGVPTQWELGTRGMLFQVGDLDSCTRCLDWAIHHPQSWQRWLGMHKHMYRP